MSAEAPLIHARGLTKKFDNLIAVDGIDFDVARGEAFGFLGPNGAGKSSTMRMIGCVSPITDGTLTVLGLDPRKDGPAIRQRLGVVPQLDTLDTELTVRENMIIYGRYFGLSRKEVRARADRLVRTYSGGMRRKLDLGASLVGAPRLLLLDEPTTGLDPRSRIDLWDAIRGLVDRGTDVLLTTQYLDEADHLAGQIVIIDHGKTVASGTPAELKQRAGRNVIDVHVRDREDLAEVAKALGHISEGDAQIDESTRRVSVVIEGGTERLTASLNHLEKLGIELDDVALRQPKLDEVFMALTGQALAEAIDERPDGSS